MPNITRDDRRKDKWMIRWREIDDAGEHQKKKRGFSTKKEAEAWYFSYQKAEEARKALEAAEKARAEEIEDDPNSMLFEELAEEWLAYQRNRVKESTYISNETVVHKNLIPTFGKKRLNQIKPIDILHWMEDINNRFSFGYSTNLVKHLSAIYKYGTKYHDTANIMEKVDRPRNTGPKKQMLIWTPEQFDIFIEHVENPEHRLFFSMLYMLGCRRGELQALQWRDIDFSAPSVHICHTVHTRAGSYSITTPKTRDSDRIIKISSLQAEPLRRIYEERHPAPEEFVFGGGDKPFADQLVYVMRCAIEESGLPRIRMHDLRHSCASYLISQGIDIVTVSKRLGHSSVKQTLDTYSHMMPSSEDRAVEVFDRLCIGHKLGHI